MQEEEAQKEEQMEELFEEAGPAGEDEDVDGFGPDLNREAVWEELERRGRETAGEQREEPERGLSHEMAPGTTRGEIREEPNEEARQEGDEEGGRRKSMGTPVTGQGEQAGEGGTRKDTHPIPQLVRVLCSRKGNEESAQEERRGGEEGGDGHGPEDQHGLRILGRRRGGG